MGNNKEYCPHCKADLQGERIPERQQELYGSTHFSRKVGVLSKERDRAVKWRCPDCDGEWVDERLLDNWRG